MLLSIKVSLWYTTCPKRYRCAREYNKNFITHVLLTVDIGSTDTILHEHGK